MSTNQISVVRKSRITYTQMNWTSLRSTVNIRQQEATGHLEHFTFDMKNNKTLSSQCEGIRNEGRKNHWNTVNTLWLKPYFDKMITGMMAAPPSAPRLLSSLLLYATSITLASAFFRINWQFRWFYGFWEILITPPFKCVQLKEQLLDLSYFSLGAIFRGKIWGISESPPQAKTVPPSEIPWCHFSTWQSLCFCKAHTFLNLSRFFLFGSANDWTDQWIDRQRGRVGGRGGREIVILPCYLISPPHTLKYFMFSSPNPCYSKIFLTTVGWKNVCGEMKGEQLPSHHGLYFILFYYFSVVWSKKGKTTYK